MKIGIFFYKNPLAQECAKRIAEWLKNKKHHPIFNEVKGIELAIILGGDGTILHVANRIANSGNSVPIIRVNFGTVGFLTNVDSNDIFNRLMDFLQGENYIIIKKARIEAFIERGGEKKSVGDVLNDVVVERILSKAISFSLKDSSGRDREMEVLSQRGDGIIFSTKTGSTAYNRSASGPILTRESRMAIAMVSPSVSPWSRSVILDELTNFEVFNFQKGKTRLVLDSKKVIRLLPGDIVSIKRSGKFNVFVEFGDQI